MWPANRQNNNETGAASNSQGVLYTSYHFEPMAAIAAKSAVQVRRCGVLSGVAALWLSSPVLHVCLGLDR